MTDEPEPDELIAAGARPGHLWWRSVSPQELRASARVVGESLLGTGSSEPDDVESWARALALQQLFDDRDAVLKAAHRACELMPATPLPGATVESVVAAEDWLKRGHAIEAGLHRCLELLEPRVEADWVAAVERYRSMLHLLDLACIQAAVHAGTRSQLVIRKPPGRWKI